MSDYSKMMELAMAANPAKTDEALGMPAPAPASAPTSAPPPPAPQKK